MPAGKRPDHPPMTALEIALPRPTAFVFQQVLASFAEGKKIGIAWNDDLFIFRKRPVARDHPVDHVAIGHIAGDRCRGIEFGIEEELARRPGEDKAMMGVGSGRVSDDMRSLSRGRVEVVVPNELIWESEGILLKNEGPATKPRGRMATAEDQEEEQEDFRMANNWKEQPGETHACSTGYGCAS